MPAAKKKRIRPTLEAERVLRARWQHAEDERDKLRDKLQVEHEAHVEACSTRDAYARDRAAILDQLRETRQLLAEAVERTSREPVVEWYRAATLAIGGRE
jgi:hypothetical protein